jgi:uncharacterized protein
VVPRDRQIEQPVEIEITHGHRVARNADVEVACLLKTASAVPQEHGEVNRIIVGNGDVEQSVTVEVAHRNRSGTVTNRELPGVLEGTVAGGTGQIGGVLCRAFRDRGDDLVILSRGDGTNNARLVEWDGRNLGPWAREVDGADVVINLAGRSVNCRYTDANLEAMMSSRVDSTRVVGLAIEKAAQPPLLWLQMSTATIYAHRFDAANDEATGRIGGDEPDAPGYWKLSIDIASAWERMQREANTPQTRKLALRSAMVMSPDRGGIFDTLLGLTRVGLGGPIAGGRQFVSWIHDRDFVRSVEFLIARDDIEGPMNLASPNPIPQRDFMAALRRAWGTRVGLPATKWMVEIGAFFLRTDTELVLKSRRVVPKRLLEAGFTFDFADWSRASRDLVKRWRTAKRSA